MVSALSLSSALLLAAPLTRASRCSTSRVTSPLTATTIYPDFSTISVSAPQITVTLSAPAGYTLGGSTTSRSPPTPASTISVCTVTPLGWGRDDAPQIMAAAEACGEDGVIELPAPYVYTISSRLYMKLVRATLNVFGTLSFTPDLGYWIDNSHRIEFQNQSTAWIVEGEDYVITGGGWQQGGILGNGQAWYGRAAGQSNQFGRPICLSLVNSTNATVKDFTVRQGQFWTFYLQDSYDIKLTGIYINGTNTDPAAGAAGLNYEVNVDGLDSIRVNGLTTADWVFHGGDDCLAPKGNSTNMVFRNMTCVGGGIAFGSIGQYATAPDYIANVSASNITVSQNISPKYGGAGVSGGAYFKSWVGVAEGSPPQGGGGGTGRVWNITFDNLRVENTTKAVYVNKCYYKVADQANYCDTSTLQFSELSFHEVSGYVSSPYGVSFNCSGAAHCDDITITDLDLTYSGAEAGIYCDNVDHITGVNCTVQDNTSQ